MKIKNFVKLSFLWKTALIVSMLLFPTTLLNAQSPCQTVTFAQFNQRFGGQDFVFTSSTPVSSFATIGGGTPVNFTYLNVAGLPPELQGDQQARVFFSCQTSQLGFTNVGRTVQPFNSTCTIQIIRDVPASVGGGSQTNLLTATIVNDPFTSDLSGDSGGNSAGYTASTPNQQVTFTSDFLSFGATLARNLALGFSSVNPNFSINPANGFLNNFSAAGAGTFASCPPPTFNVPLAASATVGGRVLSSVGRGLSKALVTLTNSSGETFTTMTNNFGYYQFSDVSPGQTVILSVSSKRYEFAPKVLNVGEDLYELDFMPQ
jgi:hypothetical protein